MTIEVEKGDRYLSFVVVFQLIVTVVQLLLPIYNLTTVENAATLRIIITFLTYIPAIMIVLMRKPKALFGSFFIYGTILLFNYILFPMSHAFIESSKTITLTPIAILTAIFIICIKKFDIFLTVLLKISRFCPFIAMIYIYGRGVGLQNMLDNGITYSMAMGYSFLLPCLYLFKQDRLTDKILSFVLFFIIILDGSRGPVVVILLYYLYCILCTGKKANRIWILLLLSVIGVFAVSIISKSSMYESSRTVSLLESKDFLSHESGRDDIQQIVKKRILEKPIAGWGIGSDRGLVDGYAHNIFLEVFLHYGVFIGCLLFIIFFGYCLFLFKHPLRLQKQGGRPFFILILLFGFVPMLVSGSYLIDISFAVMMGYLIRFKVAKEKLTNLASNGEYIVKYR